MAAEPTILVTGIGGNVGQGVARIIRAVDPGLRIVGTNTEEVSGGNHLCDSVHRVPAATEPAYLEAITRITRHENPSLVIPCTDYEAHALASLGADLPPSGLSDSAVATTFLDKWKTFQTFVAFGLPFAPSSLPSAYDRRFSPVIVKPREGRGSRDLHWNPPRPDLYDDTFVVQEILSGDELTIAAYVTQAGQLHGFIVLRRFLLAGTTNLCETVFDHDTRIAEFLEKLIRAIPVRGPFNVQAIACSDGSIVPFEVNGRVSGTASIRHHLGFRDVEYLLAEFVWKRPLAPVRITPGSAVRYLTDVIYPGLDLVSSRDRATPHIIF